MLYVFGDSWGYGAELNPGEKPFAHALAIRLNQDYTNLSRQGSSLGEITDKVLAATVNMTEDDYVVVIVPPDTRWYKVHDGFKVQTIKILDEKKHKELVMSYNIPWFIYHHNLFIYAIISAVASKTKKLILAHNYGQLVIINTFADLIDMNYFLSEHSLTKILSGHEWENNYVTIDVDGPDVIHPNKFFDGDNVHPNQAGHLEIARLLYDKFIKE